MTQINFQIRKAAEWINLHNGVIAYPTEAVYGFGCSPDSNLGLSRILKIKQRDWQKGMILVASHMDQVIPYISETGLEFIDCLLIEKDYPVTWLLPVEPQVSQLLRGTHQKIAIRISNHPLVQALCETANSAIVSTSANRAGQPPFTKAHQVRNQFHDDLDQVLSGNVGSFAKPSAIIDAETQTIIRAY
ncbi:L-threonylcarbamoyladenylate synthase [Kangiella sp. TOML190]|uniref:L-threonylcarbamoyladenylate synthase n=1 Tax=Kangiella sp. TOML190 TaxID=2931351 RepID=UPI002040BBDF|nr:Sua5/YciO/YrdC/YwlC family protein [Kangiella sp. TOML190]